jgi:hypothetical protein
MRSLDSRLDCEEESSTMSVIVVLTSLAGNLFYSGECGGGLQAVLKKLGENRVVGDANLRVSSRLCHGHMILKVTLVRIMSFASGSRDAMANNEAYPLCCHPALHVVINCTRKNTTNLVAAQRISADKRPRT